MIGEILGSYVIERKLGEGGMGEVYLAAHRRIVRRVAIKLLRPDLSRNETVVERLFTEARATSLIEHPNIVQVVDCDVHPNGRAYIVMEYLSGETLAHALSRVGDLRHDMGAVVAIGAQIADALTAAHTKGIIHRDLKPDNVFLVEGPPSGPRLTVKVLDFGIAKLAAGIALGSAKTRTGSLLGTPLYMSPEQCRSAPNVDHRSDIYSLGCVLYQMLTGRPPFLHEAFGELILAHVQEPPQPPSALGVASPHALEALMMSMLAKSPDQRPRTMSDVAASLRDIARASGVPDARLSVERPPEAGSATRRVPVRAGLPPIEPMERTARLEQTAPIPAARPAGDTMGFPPNNGQTTLSRGAAETLRRPAPRSRAPFRLAIGLGAALAAGGGAWVRWFQPRATPAPAPRPAATNEVISAPMVPLVPPTPAVVAPSPNPTVAVNIVNVPQGLSVRVDDRPASLPLRLSRDGRPHLLAFAAPGFRDETRSVEANGDATITLALERSSSRPTGAGSPHARRHHLVDVKPAAQEARPPSGPPSPPARPPEPADANKRPSAITDI